MPLRQAVISRFLFRDINSIYLALLHFLTMMNQALYQGFFTVGYTTATLITLLQPKMMDGFSIATATRLHFFK